MSVHSTRRFVRLALVAAVALCTDRASAADAAKPASFDDVRSVFKKRCSTCHNEDRARGDLDLTSIEGVNAGSSSGPVVVPGKPEESLVYTLASHQEDPKMPPGAPRIPQRELDIIRDWITRGVGEGTGGSMKKPAMVLAVKAPAKQELASSESLLEPVKPWPQRAAVTALATSPKSDLIAVAGLNQILLFEGVGRPAIGALPFPEGKAFLLKFVRGGDVLLAGGGVGAESGKVVAFDVATHTRLFAIGEETDIVLAADLSPDGFLVAMGGPGRTVKVYRTADGELVATLKKHTDWILSLAFSPDGLLLASSDRFGGVQVWEAKTGQAFDTLRGHTGPVNAVWWPRSSEELATAGEDGTVRRWNMHEGTSKSVSDPGIGPILSACCDHSGRTLVGGRRKAAALMNESFEVTATLPFDEEVTELALTHSQTHSVVAGAGGTTQFIDLSAPSSRLPVQIPVMQAAVAVSPLRRSQLQPPVTATPEPSAPIAPAPPSPSPPVASLEESDRLSDARRAAALADAAVKATEAALATQKAVADRLHSDLRRLEKASTPAAARKSSR